MPTFNLVRATILGSSTRARANARLGVGDHTEYRSSTRARANGITDNVFSDLWRFLHARAGECEAKEQVAEFAT